MYFGSGGRSMLSSGPTNVRARNAGYRLGTSGTWYVRYFVHQVRDFSCMCTLKSTLGKMLVM